MTLIKARDFIMGNLENPEASVEIDEASLVLNLDKILFLSSNPNLKLSDMQLYIESYEIYNEDIYDLLATYKKDRFSININRPKMQMKEKDNRKAYIKGKEFVVML